MTPSGIETATLQLLTNNITSRYNAYHYSAVRMAEGVCFEISVSIYQNNGVISDCSNFQGHRHLNLNSHLIIFNLLNERLIK